MENIYITGQGSKNIIFHGPSCTVAVVPKDSMPDLRTVERHFDGKKAITRQRKCERGTRLHHLILNVAQTCNMKCRYCYAGEGEYGGGSRLMDENIMMKAADHIFEEYKDGIDRVSFFGGEPFLAEKVMEQAVDYINSKCRSRNIEKPKYDSVCNGTLISSEKTAGFVCENFSNLTISIDGPAGIHNTARIMKDNRNSYEIIGAAVKNLKGRGPVLNAAMTVSGSHINAFKNGGTLTSWKDALYEMGFDYVTYGVVHTQVRDFEITDTAALAQMLSGDVREELRRFMNGPYPQRFPYAYYRILYAVLSKKYTDECRCGLNQIFVTADGEYYPCQFYYNRRLCKVGKIGKLDDSLRCEIERGHTRENVKQCGRCALRTICTVWCPGSAVEYGRKPDAVNPTDCICFKAVFEQLLKFLVETVGDSGKRAVFARRIKQYDLLVKNDFEKAKNVREHG